MNRKRPAAVDDVVATEVLVVGAGAAGLAVALEATPRPVTLLTKGRLAWSGASPWAQGGIAAAVGAGDAPGRHAADTLAAAGGLADEAVVDLLTREAPRTLGLLLGLGARFERAPDGGLTLGREAGHRRRRIVHADGDATGREVVRVLVEAVRRTARVTVVEGAAALRLLVDGDGAVLGVLARHADGRRVRYAAHAVVLATGGIGHLFSHTTNPREATGDGLALAAMAGARLADLEFVQFHPTALAVGADPMPLLTEAVRGEGAVVVDESGRRFLADRHPDGDLAPRDVVAQAIWRHLAAGHRTFLDLRGVSSLEQRFPTLVASCRRHSLDPCSAPVPVSPAAHYHMGGVAVDPRGRTSVPGLWACGEVACNGAHGANRLGSNSLLEALVFGSKVGAELAGQIPDEPTPGRRPIDPGQVDPEPAGRPDPLTVAELRRLMWERVGLVRDADGLAEACARLDRWCSDGDPAIRQLATVGRLVATAAAARTESRGAHHRTDHPLTQRAWQRRLFVTAAVNAFPSVTAGPVLIPARRRRLRRRPLLLIPARRRRLRRRPLPLIPARRRLRRRPLPSQDSAA